MKLFGTIFAVSLFLSVNLPAQDNPETPGTKAVVPTISETIRILKQDIRNAESGNTSLLTPGIVGFDVSNLGTNINYHDGPVMGTTHNIYFIWYGNWSGQPATTILPQFIRDISGSTYQDIVNT